MASDSGRGRRWQARISLHDSPKRCAYRGKPGLAASGVDILMPANHYVIRRLLPAMLLAASGTASPAQAAELGVRISALRAATELQGFGLAARWPLSQGYFVQATLDRQHYARAANPAELPPAALQSHIAGAAIGREYRGDRALDSWFWSWGISAGFPATARSAGAVAPARFDAAMEVHLTAALGISRQLSEHWSLTGAARIERHFIDWRLTDEFGTLLQRRDSQSASGLSLSVNYRF